MKVSKVVAGFGHAFVLLASGEVRCWGQNGEGQVGDGVGASFWPEPNKVAFWSLQPTAVARRAARLEFAT